MADNQIWDKIHSERASFADFVAGLKPKQLEAPSLCGGWRVRDVIGHVISAGNTSVGGFFAGMIGSGFRFNAFAQKGVNRYNSGSPAELADKIRATASMTKSPPGPKATWLGEIIVHSEDVRRALGQPGVYPAEHIIPAADFFKNSNLLIGSKKRITGFTLRATDMDWSTGNGPEVSGPGAALVSAMTGRKAALDDLKGDGVQQFAARF
jgi:uncharacterized protein (TIGR03083 family)